KESKLFVSSNGAAIEQELVESGGRIDAFAANDELTQIRSYPSAHSGSSTQGRWEVLERLALEREAPRVAEQAAALLRADPCPAGGRPRGAAGARAARCARAAGAGCCSSG